jgi:hypothetical protein
LAQSRPIQVATQASLPSASASTHHAGAYWSVTRWPPAAIARRDARLGLVVRHGDVDVDPIALRARRVHLLEPERRPAAVGVDQILGPLLAPDIRQ